MFDVRQPHNEGDDPVIFFSPFRRVSLSLSSRGEKITRCTDCWLFFFLYRQINFSAFFFLDIPARCIYLLLFLVTVVWMLGASNTSLKEKETIFSFTRTKRRETSRQTMWVNNWFHVKIFFMCFDMRLELNITMRYFSCLSVSWRLVICCVKNKSTDKRHAAHTHTFRAETSSAKVTMLLPTTTIPG